MLSEKKEELAWICTSALGNPYSARLVNLINTIELLLCHRVHHVEELFDAVCRILLLALADHVGVEARDHANDVAEGAHVQH